MFCQISSAYTCTQDSTFITKLFSKMGTDMTRGLAKTDETMNGSIQYEYQPRLPFVLYLKMTTLQTSGYRL